MTRISIRTVLFAAAGSLALSGAALAAEGQFKDMCAYGLSMGKKVPTNCSVNEDISGKTYCFSSKDAQKKFNENKSANLKKAENYYATLNKN